MQYMSEYLSDTELKELYAKTQENKDTLAKQLAAPMPKNEDDAMMDLMIKGAASVVMPLMEKTLLALEELIQRRAMPQ